MSRFETVVELTVNSTVHRVFAAWTDPTAAARWFGQGAIAEEEFAADVRVGGRWQWARPAPDGSVVRFGGEYLRVSGPTLIEYSEEYPAELHHDQITRIDWEQRGEVVEMRITIMDAREEERDRHRDSRTGAGMRATLDRFRDFVQRSGS